MKKYTITLGAIAGSLLVLGTLVAGGATKVSITFNNHLQAKLPEQDVFIQGKSAGQVVRVEQADIDKDSSLVSKKVYSTSTATSHDPFKVGTDPLGPFKKGKDLGFTLQQWLNATGGGSYEVDGGSANLHLTFDKLVPKGVYTVWCSRLTFPPNPKVVDAPCGAADGSQNTFKADGKGSAAFTLEKFTPLEESTKETASVIALAYHSDGKTYGAVPGDFGSKTHVQVFSLIPEAKVATAPTVTPTVTPTIAPNPSPTPPTTPPAAKTGSSSSILSWVALIVILVIIGIAIFASAGSGGSGSSE